VVAFHSIIKRGIMFKTRSKVAFLAAVFATAYAIYSLVYWGGVVGETQSTDAAEAIGSGLATLLVVPHIIVTVLGALFGVIAFFTRSAGLILTSAILYSVAAALFFVYAIFLVPSIVLGFVGYSKQKKLKRASS
jgi:heme/copper-type cytochrome/quinol oxidase subunit 2